MDFPIREVDHDAGSYPALLREIPHPPQTLYTRGSSIPAENILLCVVGSRKISSYGKAVCEQLIPPLAGYGISIVSGLALGVDATAHALALSAGIHCIAVPGSGIDDSVLYPRANARLGREILTAGGTLISEFEPYFKATEWSFPQRNRIMAGMSHATLLIEAGERSGTLITARLASDYNRDVLVVPGSIFSHNSSGVHQFLKLGAAPITNADDILDALGIKKNTEQRHQHTYTELEKHILDVLAAPHTFDQLFEHFSVIGMENDLTSTLSLLELNGYIKNSGGVFYKNA